MVNIAYYDSIFDIVEDYNDPSTTAEEKDIIFEELKNRIWKCGNYRTTSDIIQLIKRISFINLC